MISFFFLCFFIHPLFVCSWFEHVVNWFAQSFVCRQVQLLLQKSRRNRSFLFFWTSKEHRVRAVELNAKSKSKRIRKEERFLIYNDRKLIWTSILLTVIVNELRDHNILCFSFLFCRFCYVRDHQVRNLFSHFSYLYFVVVLKCWITET